MNEKASDVRRTMQEVERFILFLVGGLFGLDIAAILFPSQTGPQIAGIVIGQAIGLFVIFPRIAKRYYS